MAIRARWRAADTGETAPSAWRSLGLFWALILAGLGCGAVALQLLGPPAPPRTVGIAAAPLHDTAKPVSAPPPQAHAQTEPPKPAPVQPEPSPSRPAAVTPPEPVKPVRSTAEALRPGAALPGPIAAPDPALLEPAPGSDTGMLPRIGADGRTPGQVYARGFAAAPDLPRIGLVLAGIGLNTAESMRAIQGLPPEITLAVSPYAAPNPVLLNLARQQGHELLLAIPLEPVGYPLNDPGEHALMSVASVDENLRNLDWALGRFAGYAGVTAALGGQLNGERFATLADRMQPVLNELASRGLFYVDPRMLRPSDNGQPQPALPYVWNRSIDLTVDEPADAAALEAKLVSLEGIARDKGSALGLVGLASPLVLDRLAAWSSGLAGRGFVLAPASALMLPPGKSPE